MSAISNNARDDVDFEPEDELGTVTAYKEKLAKLKDELERVKNERQEYLDGWQRAKADLINERRDMQGERARTSAAATERAVESIIPTLDSFDLAMQSTTWHSVDPTWRAGVEGIAKQLEAALGELGAKSFGSAGEAYDPLRHEVFGEEKGETANVVARVVRRGWLRGETIIRPAHIILATT